MGFQVSGLPGNPAIAHAVRFIETVSCEMNHQVKYIVGGFFFDAIFHSSFHEGIPVLLQDFRLFMAHGAAKHIGLAQAESPHGRGDLHDLFLIENNPIGFFQNRFQGRMGVFDRNLSVFSFDEIFRHAASQWSRSVQRHHWNQIFEPVRMEFHEKVGESSGFRLEDPDGISFAKHLASLFVHARNAFNIQVDPPIDLNHFQCVMDDRQIAKPQKVHFQKSQLFHQIFFVLGLNEIILGKLNGHIIVHWL